jgi:hypothetical protein
MLSCVVIVVGLFSGLLDGDWFLSTLLKKFFPGVSASIEETSEYF